MPIRRPTRDLARRRGLEPRSQESKSCVLPIRRTPNSWHGWADSNRRPRPSQSRALPLSYSRTVRQYWPPREDSNPRPAGSKPAALPSELRGGGKVGADGRPRTGNTQLGRLALYPLELRPRRVVWEAGFEPAASWFQTRDSGQAELLPDGGDPDGIRTRNREIESLVT